MASIVAKIIGDATDFDKKVTGAKATLGTFKNALGTLGVGIGMTAVLAWFNTLVKEGDRLVNTADKLGVTTTELQEFTYAATQNGLAITTAEMGLQRFTRRLGEAVQGKGELLPILEQYNIQLKNVDGTTKSASDVLKQLADVIKDTRDPAERLRIAFKAFDSEGVALVNVMQQGSQAFDEFSAKARDAGLIIEEGTLRNLSQLSNEMQTFWQWTKAAGSELAGSFIGAINTARGVVSNQLLPTERELEMKGFEEVAERIIRAENTVLNLRIKNSKTFRDHVEIGGEVVKLSDAIARKAEELYIAEKNANLAMRNRVEENEKLNAAKEEELVAAATLEGLNKKVAEHIIQGADAVANKMLPAQEKLLQISQQITQLSAIANDETESEERRVAAAKELVKLLGEQQTLALKIGADKAKELAAEEKKTAELQKQSEKLEAQREAIIQQTAALRAQFQEFEESRYDPTFQDFLSGTGGGVRQRAAQNYVDDSQDLTAAIARGSSEDILADYVRRLETSKEDFQRLTGLNPEQANPFKAALEKAEQELEKQTAQLETL